MVPIDDGWLPIPITITITDRHHHNDDTAAFLRLPVTGINNSDSNSITGNLCSYSYSYMVSRTSLRTIQRTMCQA